MTKFVIERAIPGVGKMSSSDLQAISARSCDVLRSLGGGIQWQHSFVTDDKIYCVYVAENADLVREHAARGGFPADVVTRVHAIIDPTTAG